MTTLTALLGLNWLEQKNQGEKTRELLQRQHHPISPVTDADRAAIRKNLERLQNDPKSFMHWQSTHGLLTTMRMVIFGLTKKELAEATAAWNHECGFDVKK